MKKALLIAITLASAIATQAQKFELGFNAGVTAFKVIPVKHYLSCFPDPVSINRPGYYTSVRGAITHKKWEMGVGIDNYRVNVHSYSYKSVAHTKINTFAPTVYINRRFRISKSYIYTGATLGASLNTRKYSSEVESPRWGMQHYSYNNSYRGAQGGLQAGYTFPLSKKINGSAEVAARYMFNGTKGQFNPLVFPISAGIRYSL